MKKKNQLFNFSYFLIFLLTVLTLGACGRNNDLSETTESTTHTTESIPVTTDTTNSSYPDNPEYSLVVEGFEWGASVTKMVVSLGADLSSDAIDTDTFVVKAGKTSRTIIDVYISDDFGNKVFNHTSQFFTIEMEVGFDTSRGFGSPLDNSGAFTFNGNTFVNTWKDLSSYSLALAENQTLIIGTEEKTTFEVAKENFLGRITPQLKDIVRNEDQYEDFRLRNGAYETEELANDSGKNPLIIWLHGGGEGGKDVDIALLGNQVTNLWESDIQANFKTNGLEGAYVLAVQTPTMWMDSGEGYQHGDNSLYTDALWNTITKYVNGNSDIDTKRIYLGGCSNGGYMTMNMLFNYPDYFAAAFPIAEAYGNNEITNDMIQSIKHIPIWFTHAEDDTTVVPTNNVIPTYVRLIQAGAENVHFSYYENVIGLDDPGVQYMGHWSWIYTLQDRTEFDQDQAAVLANGIDAIDAPSVTPVIIDGEDVSIWTWIARQVKQ